jgi:hypothetical protein
MKGIWVEDVLEHRIMDNIRFLGRRKWTASVV